MKIAILILVYILYVYILNNIVWVGVYVLKYSIRGVYNKISSFRNNNKNNENNENNNSENEKKNKERKLLKNKYEIIESDIENNIKKKNKNNIPMKNMEMIPISQEMKRSKSDTDLEYVMI